MSNRSPKSPSDKKKKATALPSLLSKLRNAQAVIGRAADDLHDRESRPLVGTRPQLQRNPPPSFSNNLQNFSQRFGSQLRKRGRKKTGHGVTGVPQSFYVAVLCFFFAFPLFFLLFILARHAVFGDEAESSQAHKHEVPILNNTIVINDPEDEIKGLGHNIMGVNQTSVNGEATKDSQLAKQDDPPEALIKEITPLIESETSGLHDETHQTIGDTSDQSVSRKDPIAETNIAGLPSAETLHSVIGEGDGSILAQKEIKSSPGLKEPDKDISTSIKKENVHSSSDYVEEKDDVKMKKESSHSNLRGLLSKSKRKEHVKTRKVQMKIEKED